MFEGNLSTFLFDAIIVMLVPSILLMLLVQAIYSIKLNIKSSLLFVVLLTILTTIGSKLGEVYGMSIKALISTISTILLINLIFKVNWKKSILVVGLFIIVAAISNAIVTVINASRGITLDMVEADLRLMLFSHIIVNIIIISVIYLIKYLKVFKQFPEEIRTKVFVINLLYLAFIIIITVINFDYQTRSRESIDIVAFHMNIFLTLGFFIFSILNINVFFKLETQSQELEYQKFYNKTLNTLMDDLKRFKHNYNNILAVMGGYMALNKWEELCLYYKEITFQNHITSSIGEESLLKIRNAAVLGILTNKFEYAQESNVNLELITETEINEIGVRISELCEILGILLDNAIEAAMVSEKKKVRVIIKSLEGNLLIEIENSVNQEVDTNVIFKEGYSTKGEGRGLGLDITNKIIARNKKLFLNTFSNKNSFKQELIIGDKN